MKKLEQINMKAKSFVVFNNILEDDVMKAFLNMIDIKEKSDIKKVENTVILHVSYSKKVKIFLIIYGSLLYLMKIYMFIN